MAAKKKKKTSSRTASKKTATRAKKTAPPKEREVYLVGSKVRTAIKDANCNTGGDALDGLNEVVASLIQQAVARATANNRKTVRSHDFYVPGK